MYVNVCASVYTCMWRSEVDTGFLSVAFHLIYLNISFLFIIVCVCSVVGEYMCRGACVEVKDNFHGVSSFFALVPGFQVLNLGHQAWGQTTFT